jgi:hypothetical protein
MALIIELVFAPVSAIIMFTSKIFNIEYYIHPGNSLKILSQQPRALNLCPASSKPRVVMFGNPNVWARVTRRCS